MWLYDLIVSRLVFEIAFRGRRSALFENESFAREAE